MFTSCCPGWVRFLKSQYPERTEELSTAKSPQQMFGAIAKTYFAEKIGIDPKRLFVVSIMPCVAKKSECALPTMRDEDGIPDVDVSITTRELDIMLRANHISPSICRRRSSTPPLGSGTGAAVVFGATGGVMDAALRSAYYLVTGENPDPDAFTAVRGMDGWKEASFSIPTAGEVKVAVVSGLGNARKLLYAPLSGARSAMTLSRSWPVPAAARAAAVSPFMTGRSWRRHAAACSGGSTRAKRCASRTKILTCRRSIATISASPSEKNRIICSTLTIWHGRCRRRREDNKQAKARRTPLFRIFIFLQITVAFCGFLWYNKCTLDHPARKRHFFMEFVANESKKVEIETSTGVYQRHAIQTHFVQIGENYIDLIERYVKPLYEEGDLLSISEKVIALCQKRIVYRKDIHPGFWAKLLCRFVHVTPAGPGAGTPHKMQLIIMICGLPRVLLAAFCSAVTKLFGKKGVFYKVCGHEVDGIDGLIDYDISFKSMWTTVFSIPKTLRRLR